MTSSRETKDLLNCPSIFTMTFAVEILGIEVWDDCNEGWLDLAPCTQGVKFQYQLYPGKNFDIDLLVWPRASKVWCGPQFGWVRTWLFLERRWVAFSISHKFPVRVTDMQNFVASVNVNSGVSALSSNAKSDKNPTVFIPNLEFGESRYFAPARQSEQTLKEYCCVLIWTLIESYIPPSILDGTFDLPQRVTDVRHQNAVMTYVKDAVLNRKVEDVIQKVEIASAGKKDAKDKSKPDAKVKFELKLTGHSILAGIGRVVPFETFGDRPETMGEVFVFISSSNLPAPDDLPIFFVNVENLFDAPIGYLSDAGITQLYTKWKCGPEEHVSQCQVVSKEKQEINFCDHHSLALPYNIGPRIVIAFQEDYFEIELRGIREIEAIINEPKLFGYDHNDWNFDKDVLSKVKSIPENDILIAICKINVQTLSRNNKGFIREEFPLYPPRTKVVEESRAAACTNDLNMIRSNVKPNIFIPTSVVLEAQMTLKVSIGLVGCRHLKVGSAYSRLHCLFLESESAFAVIVAIIEINKGLARQGLKDQMLTGWAVDTGDYVYLYVEGPRDGQILVVWNITEDHHRTIKTCFSISAVYVNRMYSELMSAAIPFIILKMYTPLTSLLACPAVYVRPGIPLPARSALLKLDRLITKGLKYDPRNSEMPTIAELRSFRLELCTPTQPAIKDENDVAKLKLRN